MKNEMATVISRVMTIAAGGTLEQALRSEGVKGCASVLSPKPVTLEPSYRPFDGAAILAPEAAALDPVTLPAAQVDWVTLLVFAGPEDILSLEWLESLLRAWSVFTGPFVFELVGTGGRVSIRFAVPQEQSAGFTGALTGVFPAVRLLDLSDAFPNDLTSNPLVVEELVPVPPYHRTLSLIGKEGASPLTIAYRALEIMQGDELGFYQVLFQPPDVSHDWHFNIQCLVEGERRAVEYRLLGGLTNDFSYDETLPSKLEASASKKVEVDCAVFATVCRYGGWMDPAKKKTYLQTMRAATGVLRFGNRQWRRLRTRDFVKALGAEATQEMVQARQTHRPGLILTSHELASFAHLPNEWAFEMFRSVDRREGIGWDSATHETPRTAGADLQIGINIFAGRAVPVIVPSELRSRHLHAIGWTGSGKTYELRNLMLQDAESGQGFCLIDPHGDLAYDMLGRLPEHRLDDLVYVSFTERGFVPQWNPFRAVVEPGKFADDFSRSLAGTMEYCGPRMANIIRHAAYATHLLHGSLADFHALLSDEDGEDLRHQLLSRLDNPEARRFWVEELPVLRGEALDAVRNKVSHLFLHETLGPMLRQRENRLDPRQWMDRRKVVIVNLVSGLLGGNNARFIGGLITSLIHRAALSRADLAEEDRVPFFLYLDECHQVQTAALDEILSEARKYGLGLILAHQEMKQLELHTERAVGNCSTRLVFRPVGADVPRLRKELLHRVEEEELQSLGLGQAFALVGNRLASVSTVKCTSPRLRDPRRFARLLAQRDFAPITNLDKDRRPATPPPRPRVYETFGGDEGES